jgi:hypothetical protein
MKAKIGIALCFNFYRRFVSHFFLGSQVEFDFLHFSKREFCSLERFSFDKAADLLAFYPDNDDDLVQMFIRNDETSNILKFNFAINN